MNERQSIKRIFLTGYMGSGKSLVAASLSRQLEWSLTDLDALISDIESLSINEIFKEHGEQYFRAKELQQIQKLCADNLQQVISLGGGAFAQDKICNFLLEDHQSIVIYLKYSANILANRLNQKERSSRPLIKQEGNLQKYIEDHLMIRSPYYERSHLIIHNEPDSDQIVNQVISYLNYRNQKLSTI